MILDWHSHIYTPEEAADDRRTFDGKSGPSWGVRGCPMVLENFLEAHWMGVNRVLYGSDAPPLTSLKPRAIKLINELDISAADKEKIFWGNAQRLLRLN